MNNDNQSLQEKFRFINQIMSHGLIQNDERLLQLWTTFQKWQNPHLINAIYEHIQRLGYQPIIPDEMGVVLPNSVMTQGEIHLGYDIQSYEKITITNTDLDSGVMVVGKTGSGKTTDVRSVIPPCLSLNRNVIVFQKKLHQFEYLQHHNQYPFTWMPLNKLRLAYFERTGTHSYLDHCKCMGDLFANIYGLQHSMGYIHIAIKSMLKKWSKQRLAQGEYPTLIDLMDALHEIAVPSQKKHIVQSAENILRILWEGYDIFRARNGMIHDLFSKPTIIQYELGDTKIVELIISYISHLYMAQRSSNPGQPKLLFILDDFQDFVFDQKGDRIRPIFDILTIAREYGLGYVFLFQTLEGNDRQFDKLVATKIVGSLSNAREAKHATEILGLRGQYAQHIGLLQKGEFFIKSPGSVQAISFKAINTPHPIPSDFTSWQRQNQQKLDRYSWKPIKDKAQTSAQHDRSIPQSSEQLLWQIFNTPYRTATEYKDILALSTVAYQKAIQHLIDTKYVRIHKLSYWNLVEIMPNGWSFLQRKPTPHKGGFLHAFSVRKVVDFFRQKQYNIHTEKMLLPVPHCIDVVAQKDSSLIAIEVETGASTIEKNMLACSQTSADNILCVVTNNKALQQVSNLIKNQPKLSASTIEVWTVWKLVQSDNNSF